MRYVLRKEAMDIQLDDEPLDEAIDIEAHVSKNKSVGGWGSNGHTHENVPLFNQKTIREYDKDTLHGLKNDECTQVCLSFL